MAGGKCERVDRTEKAALTVKEEVVAVREADAQTAATHPSTPQCAMSFRVSKKEKAARRAEAERGVYFPIRVGREDFPRVLHRPR